MSRTDDVRGEGRERGGSGGGSPFVRWGDDYTWLEGRMVGSFQTKYGLAVTLEVSAVHDGGLEAQGRDDDGENYTTAVRSGMKVNVGTQSAALAGKITEEDGGKSFHIAFEGWEHPQGGNRYRVFTVIELTEREREPAASAAGPPSLAGEPWPDDEPDEPWPDDEPDSDLPF